ncbi:hypothetical protein [Pedomonas mirosovicensis]|uniref:hypothetical protein n=1 Tax=Pedomonas mirosovicensis TaxID=2908641 RepID=UPI00216AAFEA|nr:hypothetical protein [Pedomonas mirosovicensis]MCH8683956.1 hypothetical protein [Pedomonas mirosovicensis]
MQKLAVRLGSKPVRPLLEKMNPGGWTIDTAAFPGGEIGVIHAPASKTAALSRTGVGPGLLRFPNGDIIAWAGLPIARNQRVPLTQANGLPGLAPELDGIFAAIGWSAAEGRLYVITDFLGLQPLYVGDDAGDWLAASETKVFPYDPDPVGWGGYYLILGHAIGDATQTRHARRLRPASVLAVTPPEKPGTPPKVETTRHWDMPQEGDKDASAEEAAEALLDSAASYQALVGRSVCLLSGGFDSRLILSILTKLGVERRQALILSHYDEDADLDGKIAATIARRTQTPVTYFQPDRDYFSSRTYLDYLWSIDGATPTLYIFMAQMISALKGIDAIWEGLVPAMAFKTIHRTEDGTFDGFLREKCRAIPETIQFLKPQVRKDFLDAFHAEFDRTRTLYPDTPHGMWQWILENRIRHRVSVNPTKAFANRVTPLNLGASRRLFSITAPAPYGRRRERSLYLEVYRIIAPELARVPFYSGGVLHRGDAPWYSFAACKLMQDGWKALACYPGLARRLGLGQHFGFAPSRFVRHPAIYKEEDDYLDMDVVRRAETDDQLRKVIGKFLFHWRTTRWVHEDRLYSTLGEARA